MELIFGSDISYIMIIGFTMLGGLMNIFRYMAYHIFIKESKRTKESKNKYICSIIAAFGNRKNVNNVDNYVDKSMYNLKFCGFKLYTWDKMCLQNVVFVIALVSILSILAGYGKRGQDEILLTILIGMLCTAMLIIMNMSLSSKAKRNIIYFNLVDYIDENLKPQFLKKNSVQKNTIKGNTIQSEHFRKNSIKADTTEDRAATDNEAEIKAEKNKAVIDKNDKVLSINKKKDKKNYDITSEDDKMADASVSKLKSANLKTTKLRPADANEAGSKADVTKSNREAIKKAFADAVYEAALEKLAQNNKLNHVDEVKKESESWQQATVENNAIEELIREMFH